MGRGGNRLRGDQARHVGRRARAGGALPGAACRLQEAAVDPLRCELAALALRQGAARAVDRAGDEVTPAAPRHRRYRSTPNPSRSMSGRRPDTMSATTRPQPQAWVQPFDPCPTLTNRLAKRVAPR